MPKENTANGALFRSKKKVRMVREETLRDGTVTVIDAELPIGRGWNQGNGAVDWINMGWRSYDEYMAEKHQSEVKAKRSKGGDKENAEG